MGVRSAQASQQSTIKSSITNEERKIFQNIRLTFGANVSGILPPSSSSTTKPEPKPRKQTSANLPVYDLDVDKILSLFAPEISVESSSEDFEPDESTASSPDPEADTISDESIPRKATPAEVRSTARSILQQISTKITENLRSTNPAAEEALWNYATAEIFPIVTVLQHPLLRPTANSFHRPYQLTFGELTSSDTTTNTETPLQLPECLSRVPPQTPILPLITILYPAATLLAMRHYAAYLPHSDYGFAIYPKIQSLGTTSYLLGANVHLFNCLIQLYWEVYSDFKEIRLLLDDMQDSVVPFDARTLAVLRAIVEDSRSRGGDGRAKEWWDQLGTRSGVNALMGYWVPRVEKSVEKNRRALGW